MPVYQFIRHQFIPASQDEVWDFISQPANLPRITPPSMGFQILSENLPKKMYSGMIILYKVTPFPGFRITWVTEITEVNEGCYFIDEQRVGPYVLWHHQHFIESTDCGVNMSDIVTYQPPLGPLGAAANQWVIRNKLNEIFDYRKSILEEIFPSFGA